MSGGSEKATGWRRNLTYDAPQYVVLGGRPSDGSTPTHELTQLFMERIVPRFENPVIVLRYTPDLPEPIWRLACAKMRDNASFMVYNDENVVPAMIHSGVDAAHAATYTMHGCNWPDIPGRQISLSTQFVILPGCFTTAFESADTGMQDIDMLYERFRQSRDEWDSRAPGPLRVDDCFYDGPIALARSRSLGSIAYPNMILSVCGLASVADAFAAVDHLVFQSGTSTLMELQRAVSEDFAETESLRRQCLRAPKFGQDDDLADRHAVRILHTVLEEIASASRPGEPDGICAFTCLETDMRHIRFGQEIDATPDGRHAGQPISENTSPNPGTAIRGLTAMLRSLAKLPFDRINSGALNLRISPSHFLGDEGLDRLSSVLQTYFDMGGLQVQLSFVDVEELRDAQRNPEHHRDLMVRITGYSAAFTDMAKHAQDEIIRREEMGT